MKRLDDGVMRAEAAYWLGALHTDEEVRAEAWRQAATMKEGGSWSRLAASELGMDPLRRQIEGPGPEIIPPAPLPPPAGRRGGR